MRTEKVECDTCKRDLTRTGNCEGYRLLVTPENIPTVGGFVTAMAVCPPLDRAFHFCGLFCMDKWRDRERHKNKLRAAFYEDWKQTHGHRGSNGEITSWRSPPDERLKANEIEYEAAALAAYP